MTMLQSQMEAKEIFNHDTKEDAELAKLYTLARLVIEFEKEMEENAR